MTALNPLLYISLTMIPTDCEITDFSLQLVNFFW